MSFGVTAKQLKQLIDLYAPNNKAEEMKYMVLLKGEDSLQRNLETNLYEGIHTNSLEERHAWFGHPSLPFPVSTFFTPFRYFPLQCTFFITVFLFIVERFLEGGLMLLAMFLNATLMMILEYNSDNISTNFAEPYESGMYYVLREATRREINSWELVVGDILELNKGQIIPVDGWLIEGELEVEEIHASKSIIIMKDKMRNCIYSFKDGSSRSPVLLSGSKVLSGEGKAIVLAVGVMSKMGQFIHLCHVPRKYEVVELHLRQLVSQIIGIAMPATILCIGVYIVKKIIMRALINVWDNCLEELLNGVIYYIASLSVVIPYGLPLGVCFGLKWMQFTVQNDLKIKAVGLPTFAVVNYLCYEQQEKIKVRKYKEWWNENFYSVICNEEKEEKKIEMNGLENSEEEYKKIVNESLFINFMQEPNETYEETQEKNSHIEEEVEIYEENHNNCKIHYFCGNNLIKYVTAETKNNLLFLKGDSREVLELCDKIKNKDSGEIKIITSSKREMILDIVNIMERKLLKTSIIAYQTAPMTETKLSYVTNTHYTLLYIIGASSIRDHSEYDMVRQLSNAGISTIMCSKDLLVQAEIKALSLGILAPNDGSIVLEGSLFESMVGGIICAMCKKAICQCKIKQEFIPRLRNIDEFGRLLVHFKVIGNAHYQHKYALCVGLKELEKKVIIIGLSKEDLPAMRQSIVSVALKSNQVEAAATAVLPFCSLKSIYQLLKFGRISYLFLQKYTQLCFTASFVAYLFSLICLLLFEQNSFTIAQCLWVQLGVCPLLAIALVLDNPSSKIMDSEIKDTKSLLPRSLQFRCFVQALFQLLLLLALLVTAPAFVPESADEVDLIIGNDWSAKYATANKLNIASGIYVNFLNKDHSYEKTFLKYGIYSRHLTMLYNLYVMLQIFNAFNCRHLEEDHINIFEGLSFKSFFFSVLPFPLHYLVITYSGENMSLYPKGLNLVQWAVCFGFSILVWVLGFITKLMPFKPTEHEYVVMWANQSYNLAVKTSFAHPELLDFHVEDEKMLAEEKK